MVLVSEIGDFSAFHHPKQLAAYFGLDPSERQSGTFHGTRNKMSKRGSPHTRAMLHMAVHNSVYSSKGKSPHNPVLAEYYARKCRSKPRSETALKKLMQQEFTSYRQVEGRDYLCAKPDVAPECVS